MSSVLLRHAEVGGRRVDVLVSAGKVAHIGEEIDSVQASSIDCGGGALLPGLHDHHIHLASLAADMESTNVGPPEINDFVEMQFALRKSAASLDSGKWIRANGYHERVAGELDCHVLDSMLSETPVRVQHRSGAMWVLNSKAISACNLETENHPGVERDVMGRPTGRIFGADSWLRERVASGSRLDFAAVSLQLAGFGVTGVTDATPSADITDCLILSDALIRGEIRQQVVAMGGLELADCDFPAGLKKGPVKLVITDHALPDIDDLAKSISRARQVGRRVAIHCVTNEAIILALVTLQMVGSQPGDRIEHGSVINADAQSMIAKTGLAVVTQPSFIFERGDDYLTDVEPADKAFLYRCGGLQASGIGVAGSTDAPFGSPDPWLAMRTAIDRRTRSGQVIGHEERLSPDRAIELFLGALDDPAGSPRRVEIGMVADLCLMGLPMDEIRESMSSSDVRMTFREGEVIFER